MILKSTATLDKKAKLKFIFSDQGLVPEPPDKVAQAAGPEGEVLALRVVRPGLGVEPGRR